MDRRISSACDHASYKMALEFWRHTRIVAGSKDSRSMISNHAARKGPLMADASLKDPISGASLRSKGAARRFTYYSREETKFGGSTILAKNRSGEPSQTTALWTLHLRMVFHIGGRVMMALWWQPLLPKSRIPEVLQRES
ncbi:hypothetical protein AVEN_184458-1 [Araneus ventricosus]|uniref:Uncharacterized protein n=1 Tax=Araneus ventricosus TaxID=182803 RepID=A0A4Y2BH74_ARAVE|nr:hypothetical protein AVEN_184458-1 [Araneus ventricosus]